MPIPEKNAYKNVLFLDFLFAVHRDCTDFIYFAICLWINHMKYTYSNEQHDALTSILDARNRKSITPDMPLWKLKLTEEEYVSLKNTLLQNSYRLESFGMEAAL